jgi:hypothetical protein
VEKRFDMATFLKQTDAKFYENMQAKYYDDKEKIRDKIDCAFVVGVWHFNDVIKGIVAFGVDQVCFDLMHWYILVFYGHEHKITIRIFWQKKTIVWMPVCGGLRGGWGVGRVVQKQRRDVTVLEWCCSGSFKTSINGLVPAPSARPATT